MTQITVAVSRRRLTLATATQIGARILGAALGVLVAATLARTLSRPAFGQLSLALTILALVSSLSDLGMNQIAVREMAREPARRPQIAGALATAQLITGVILALVGIAVSFALLPGHEARLMAIFVMAGMPLSAVSGLTVAFQARLRPELVILPSLIQNVVWLGVVVVLGAIGTGLALYGVGAFGAAVIQALVTLALTARVTEVSFVETRALLLSLLKLAWPIGLAGIFVTAYYRIDGVLLFHYRGATATAYYSAAYRVLDVLQILPVTVSSVLLPYLAGASNAGDGPARVRRAFELAVIVLLAVAVPAAVLGGILAPGVVALVYGGALSPCGAAAADPAAGLHPDLPRLRAHRPAHPARHAAPVHRDHLPRRRAQRRRQRDHAPALGRTGGRVDHGGDRIRGHGGDRIRGPASPGVAPAHRPHSALRWPRPPDRGVVWVVRAAPLIVGLAGGRGGLPAGPARLPRRLRGRAARLLSREQVAHA